MTKKDKIEVVIDRAKWRTGGNGPKKTGKGKTQLLNSSGYKCCLGFLCEAVGVEKSIKKIGNPAYLKIKIPEITTPIPALAGGIANTLLSRDAMEINDDTELSPRQKEEKLKRLFKDSCYRLKFVGEYKNET